MGNKLGIDLGGTKIEAVVINDAFQVVKRKRVPTNREEGYEVVLSFAFAQDDNPCDPNMTYD